jgi:predicted enzyme related to lactoylglutathione lyase
VSVGEGAVVLTTRPPQSGISLFIPVEDLDAHYRRARQFGAHIILKIWRFSGTPPGTAFAASNFQLRRTSPLW